MQAGRRAVLLAAGWIVRVSLEIFGNSGHEKVPTRGKPGVGDQEDRELRIEDRAATLVEPSVTRSTTYDQT
ncbi:hypothetical protein TNCV_4477221 [Trichonephila clavipes]|nr:hypothetical protein TNCV_4477221 [Trichonephila clavipes]